MSTTTRPVALVTGASRGIGRGIALALANEGFNLVINYAKNAPAAREVETLAQAAGAKTLAVQADISIPADRRKLVDDAVAAFGRIDLLVNNAGVAPDVRADLLDASEQSFDRLININVKGPYFLTQLVAKQMIRQQNEDKETRGQGDKETRASQSPIPNRQSAISPEIITVSSISAYTASVNRGDYCIAKAALSMLTPLYAARLAEHGINVYELRPGIIETDMTGPVKAKYDDLIFSKDLIPIRRWGKPEDVAAAVTAIARGLLPYSTGEVINVDGGFHLRRL